MPKLLKELELILLPAKKEQTLKVNKSAAQLRQQWQLRLQHKILNLDLLEQQKLKLKKAKA